MRAPISAELELAPLVELQATDARAGFALSEEADWNQTVEDWSLLIRLGRAYGIPDPAGRLVATALAVPYPSAFGWIGMVIVHEPYRRRGLASRLMERTIAELRDRDLVPFLDATPAGQAVYERMGFRPVDALARWRGPGGGAAAHELPPLTEVRASPSSTPPRSEPTGRLSSRICSGARARCRATIQREASSWRAGVAPRPTSAPSWRPGQRRRSGCSSRRSPPSPGRC